MNNNLLFFVVALAIFGCSSATKTNTPTELLDAQTKQQKLPVLEYQALTRGFYWKATIENQTISIVNEQDGVPKQYALTPEEIQSLSTLTAAVHKEGLSQLVAPTNKRYYDAAPIAIFRITDNGKTYESSNFDAGNPPQEIENIVNKIIAISNRVSPK